MGCLGKEGVHEDCPEGGWRTVEVLPLPQLAVVPTLRGPYYRKSLDRKLTWACQSPLWENASIHVFSWFIPHHCHLKLVECRHRRNGSWELLHGLNGKTPFHIVVSSLANASEEMSFANSMAAKKKIQLLQSWAYCNTRFFNLALYFGKQCDNLNLL